MKKSIRRFFRKVDGTRIILAKINEIVRITRRQEKAIERARTASRLQQSSSSDAILRHLARLERKLDNLEREQGRIRRINGKLDQLMSEKRPDRSAAMLGSLREIERRVSAPTQAAGQSPQVRSIERALLGRLTADEYEKMGVSLERLFYLVSRIENVVSGSLSDERTTDPTMSYEKLVEDMEAIKPKINGLYAMMQALDLSQDVQSTSPSDLQDSVELPDPIALQEYFSDSRVNFYSDRYKFASLFAEGARVMDVACGNGYGSSILAENSDSVLGVDRSKDAVSEAKATYKSDGLSFRKTSIDKVSKRTKYDLIVAFDAIADADDPETFLEAITARLKQGGRVILSIPNERHAISNIAHLNASHVSERFMSLVGAYFENVEYYRQNSGTPNLASNHNRARAIAAVDDVAELNDAECILAVCSEPRASEAAKRFLLEDAA